MIQNSPLLDTGKMNYFGFHVVAFKAPILALWLPVRRESESSYRRLGFWERPSIHPSDLR